MTRFLFTVLPSNDLGLMTRTLPIATDLATRGHTVAFCTPGEAPAKLLREIGIENLRLRHPLFYLRMTGSPDFRGLCRIVRSGRVRRDFGSLFSFLKKYLQAIPASLPPGTPEVWNLDHRFALAGMQNTRLVRSMCEAFATVMREYAPEYAADLIEDFAVRIGNESRV